MNKKKIILIIFYVLLVLIILYSSIKLIKSTKEKIELKKRVKDFGRMFNNNLLIPNKTTLYHGFVVELTTTTIKTNSYGFRDYEFHLKNTNKIIAAVGDSITFGMGVEINDSYPKILESMLIKKNISVYNFGVPGFNHAVEFNIINSTVLKFNPDIIILQIHENDFFEQNSDCKGINYHTEFIEFQKSCNSANVKRKYFTTEYLNKINLLLNKSKINLIVFLIGNCYIEDLKSYFNEYNIDYVDVVELLSTYSSEKEVRVHPEDGHYNRFANNVIALSLFNKLKNDYIT